MYLTHPHTPSKDMQTLSWPVNSASWCTLGKFRILQVPFCFQGSIWARSLAGKFLVILKGLHEPCMSSLFSMGACVPPGSSRASGYHWIQFCVGTLLAPTMFVNMHILNIFFIYIICFSQKLLEQYLAFLLIGLCDYPQHLSVREASNKSEWAKSQPCVAYAFLRCQWIAANIWC